MDIIRELASTCCRVATAHDVVLNGECCYTFHTPYTSDEGILVNLRTFIGTVQNMAMIGQEDNTDAGSTKAMFVRIVKKRVEKPTPPSATTDGTESSNKSPTVLGIGVEGGFQSEQDKYETITNHTVVVLEKKNNNDASSPPPSLVVEVPYNHITKTQFPAMAIQSVDSVVLHAGITTQQDVQVWQLDTAEDVPVSKYANDDLPYVDNGIRISPNPSDWKCEKSGATENLWLNLSTGYIGGGRKNWDGSGGSNGALDHFNDTGKLYPLVVKLGTITSDLDTADCYSYAPDEDGPVKIPNLRELLEKRGIQIGSMQKTVKSTAELEVELNANYAFDAITEAGSELKPVSGPGYQGLQNLGNSCYMNSVLQLLFSGTVPELCKRYGTEANGSITSHPFLTSVRPTQASNDLLCQATKVACALTSGVFAKPVSTDDEEGKDPSSTDPKYRLAPRMFKHLIGKDHVDFRTGQQQDAPHFLQYLLEKIDRAELGSSSQPILKKGDDVHVSSHLFSFQTTRRMVCNADNKVKYTTSAPETIWSLRIPMDKAVVKEPPSGKTGDLVKSPDQKRQKSSDEEKEPVPSISFNTCVEEWAKENIVDDIRWPHLGNNKHPATERWRFQTCPRYLIVQMQRYQLGPDWVPVKLEVNLDIPEEIDLDSYKSSGPQEGEELVPDDVDATVTGASFSGDGAAAAAATQIDENAIAQLMDMGFSMNSCKRALTAVGGSNVEAAMTWVFEHNTDPDFNDPLPEPSTSGGGGGASASASSAGVDETVVQSLVETLGCFTFDQVRAALKETAGAADRAADWLFSHMDDLDGAIAALQSKKTEGASSSGSCGTTSASKIPLDDGQGKYVMVGMISHIGKNTGSGHYVAHLKRDGKWIIFNDEKVALSSNPPFEHAYLYLFQRKDTIGAPHPSY